MGVVTALEPQKRKKDRVNVFIDGEFGVGLSLEVALKNGLKVGKKVSSEKLEELIRENELEKAMVRVYKLLSYRPRSEREISDYLAKKKTGPLLTKLVIATLKKQKYLDDEEFARWWVDQRSRFRPRGKRALRGELIKKGVSREIIDQVFQSELADRDLQDLALKAARKKQARYRDLDQQEFRKKMTAFLARRGFNWETIKTVLAKIKKEG